ncbi:MAG: hypothetical protein GYA21_19710 [Myxococcales bacterium]|nr:hypothetical protein [Myxococcales bacterium]
MTTLNTRKSTIFWIISISLIFPLTGLAQNLDDDDAIEEWVPPPGDPAEGPTVPDAPEGTAEDDQGTEPAAPHSAIVYADDGEEASSEVQPIPDEGALVSPGQEVDLDFFIEKLSPYGEWLWTDQYGWVWRPNGTGANWRPYTYGRWLYTDAGWYWHSYWSWGWAPFHYGNWAFMSMLGWVWVPSTVWGPAWVMWRYTDGYLGWAPIPPGYAWGYGWGYYPVFYDGWVFIDWGFFWDPHPYHHYRHRRHCQDDFRRSHYPRGCRDSAHRNCQKGFTERFVARHAKSDVPKYRMADTSPRYVGSLKVQDGKVQVFRPRFQKASVLPSARPATTTRPAQPVFGDRPRVRDLGIIPNAREVERPRPLPEGQDEPMNRIDPGQSPMRFPEAGESIQPRQPAMRPRNMPRNSVDLERLGPALQQPPASAVEPRAQPSRERPTMERSSPGGSRTVAPVAPITPHHAPSMKSSSPSHSISPSVSPRPSSSPSGSRSSGSSGSSGSRSSGSSGSSSGKSSGSSSSSGSSGRSHRR